MMKKLNILLLLLLGAMACSEPGVEKVELPQLKVAGDYIVHLELTQPFSAAGEGVVSIYNTADVESDSIWIEDPDFFDSKVKIKWDGAYAFSAVQGDDLAHGEVVDITGQIFPEKDSIHVEWRYLQGTGDPADDYIVVANGVRYNGLTN